MKSTFARPLVEGAVFGALAGVVFALAEMAAMAVMGGDVWAPFGMFASVLIGREALAPDVGVGIYVLGGVVHLALSAIFGLVYGLLNSALTAGLRASFLGQAVLGLAFGVGLWLVNFQVIADAIYPWFLQSPQVMQAMLHALFFGLPLGLMFAASERRAYAARAPAPMPA